MSRTYRSRAERMDEIEDAVALFWRRHGRPPIANDVCALVETGYEQAKKILAEMVHGGRVISIGRAGYMLPVDADRIRVALRGTTWRSDQ